MSDKTTAEGKSKLTYVGVDDGHYAVKVCLGNGAVYSFPSRAAQGKKVLDIDEGSNSSAFYQTEEGATFTVSEFLTNYEDTRFADYPKSPLNRVLIHHALLRAGLGGKNVAITTGLPVSHYYLPGGQKNEALIKGKIINLNRGVTSASAKMAKIVKSNVSTEAISAYFDMIMNMDGSQSEHYEQLKEETVGVIDIGGKTTDCAVVHPGGQQVDADRSGSFDVGLLNLNDTVSGLLRARYELENVPPRMVEQAIRTGKVKIAGEQVTVADLVAVEKQRLVEKMISGVRTKIGNGKDLDSVIFVGGGSIVLREQLTPLFKHGLFPEHPEFANARGMYKIAKYIFGEDEANGE